MLTVPGQAACSCEHEIVTGGRRCTGYARGYLARDGTGDERVGRQRKERTVLLEAPHGKDRDLP